MCPGVCSASDADATELDAVAVAKLAVRERHLVELARVVGRQAELAPVRSASSRAPDAKSAWMCVSSTCVIRTCRAAANSRYTSMSRRGSTRATVHAPSHPIAYEVPRQSLVLESFEQHLTLPCGEAGPSYGQTRRESPARLPVGCSRARRCAVGVLAAGQRLRARSVGLSRSGPEHPVQEIPQPVPGERNRLFGDSEGLHAVVLAWQFAALQRRRVHGRLRPFEPFPGPSVEVSRPEPCESSGAGVLPREADRDPIDVRRL